MVSMRIMVPDTGYLKYFELELYEGGFVLLFPDKDTKTPSKFVPSHKLFHVLKESAEWGAKLDIATIGALNDAIAQGRIRDVILVSEPVVFREDDVLPSPFNSAYGVGLKAAPDCLG